MTRSAVQSGTESSLRPRWMGPRLHTMYEAAARLVFFSPRLSLLPISARMAAESRWEIPQGAGQKLIYNYLLNEEDQCP